MSIYYQDEFVTLHHGDWRDEIAPDFRADLIVTDPPYGETSLDWDLWPEGWVELAARHADSMWCFGSMRMFLEHADEFKSRQTHDRKVWKFSQDIVWEKHNGSGFHADRFRRVHEHALHWYRGDWSQIHHQTPTTPDATARAVRRKRRPTHTGDIGASAYTSVDGGPRLMTSVLFEPSMHGRAINETEKPVPLIEPLIQYACPPGGVVLDLYAGSSSTLVAARNLGIKAVGFELRERQCEAAAKRLSQGVLDFGSAS